MAIDQCIYIPFIGNEPSNLYKGLLKITGNNRVLTNYLYAGYLQQGVASAMDSQGYTKDELGEHSAQDVFNFLNGNEIVKDALNDNIAMSLAAGFMSNNNGLSLVDFTHQEAYSKAATFNSAHHGKIAYVIAHNDKFNIVIDDKSSATLSRLTDLNYQQLKWQEFTAELNNKEINVSELENNLPSLVNPLRVTDFLSSVVSYKFKQIEDLTIEEIKTIFEFTKNNPSTKSLITRFESAENLYQQIQNNTLGTAAKTALQNNLNTSKLTASDIARTISDNISSRVDTGMSLNKEYSIEKTLQTLNNKFGINKIQLIRTNDKITKLSDAAAEAVIALDRQIANIRAKTKGSSLESELKDTRENLLNEIKSKKYYAGLLDFISQASKYTTNVSSKLAKVPTGTRMEQIKARAEIIQKERNLRESYLSVLSALSNIDSLTIDANLSAEDRKTIQEEATKVKNILEKQAIVSHELAKQSMTDLCIEVFGDDPSMAPAIANMVSMGDSDISIMDIFYSIGRSSNPLIAMMGTIIQDAQNTRDKKLADVATRIRKETDKLHKAGYDSEFMYSEDGKHIISDINWKLYYKEYYKAKMFYVNAGITGTALDSAMEGWIDTNTIEEIVDSTSGRIERVPSQTYRKANLMPNLTDAQREYYNNMKQLMGELGTLLPDKYQNVYLAPQIEKNWHQVVIDGIQGKVAGKTAYDKLTNTVELLLDKMSIWKKRKDETRYGAQIEGQDYEFALGDFDNTVKKQLPIFYFGKLDNKDLLLKNYSMALQIFASSAINYNCMNEVQDVVEMAQNYISELGTVKSNGNSTTAQSAKSSGISLIKSLKDVKLLSVDSITQGYVDAQLYGITDISDSDLARIGQALIGYTSWSGLTFNVAGGVSNVLVGEYQMLIEAGVNEYYNLKDYARANTILMGDKTLRAPGTIMDLVTGNLNSKSFLIAERFNPMNENFSDLKNPRYYKSPLRQFFGNLDTGFIYGSGEALLHYTNMYAVLCHEKVIYNGKETSLYDVLDKSKKQDGNSELLIKQGATKLDGTTIDEEYLDSIKRRIKYINQQTHGSMNKEDKGIVHRHIVGRLIMNFRQWMVEHYSRRFRGKHWDASAKDVSLTNFYFGQQVLLNGKKVDLYNAFDKIPSNDGSGTFALTLKQGVTDTKGKVLTETDIDVLFNKFKKEQGWKEGYYYTSYNLAKAIATDWIHLKSDIQGHWNELSYSQKKNIERTLAEMIEVALLTLISGLLGDPEDNKGKAGKRWWIYQVRRLLTDAWAAIPSPKMAKSLITIINTPIAAMRTVDELFSILNFDLLDETVKSGRHKGENKYWRNIKKNVVPGYAQIDNLLHVADDNAMFLPYR